MSKAMLLILLQLAASAGDAYTTHKGLEGRHFERNPIARPFMQSTAGQVAFFSAETGIKISLVAVLRHKHHNHLADGLAIYGIGENAYWTVNNARELRK